ncbi:MAG: aspartyl protease family protein [Methylovirgula sp.]|uniref:aspartyl protease family protein n=1 Tax=Methylovirgula sp. TaxID=1978224 RepID=UPI003075F9A3
MKRSLRIALYLCAWALLRDNAGACSLVKVAELPLIELGNHYAVMANVAGQSRPMMVDTGAATTLLGAKAVDDLNLKVDYSAPLPKPVLGIGQTSAAVVYLNVIAPILGFGDLVFHNRSTVVASLDFGSMPEADAVGILGDDILSDYDVEFDFVDDKLTLYDEFACSDAFVPWTGAYFALPFEHRDTKIMVDIFLNGERTPAIVDTGNNSSFVSRMAPALWGALAHEMKKTHLHSMSPFNGGTSLPNQRYQFDEIRIGEDVYQNEYMKVIQVQLPGASANLGLDYWKRRKLWISYPNDLIFVSGMNASPALAYPVKVNTSIAGK